MALSSLSHAVLVGSDNANDSVYTVNWTASNYGGSFGDNGGVGFFGWEADRGGIPDDTDYFIYTSSQNGLGTSGPNIDNNGRSFGITTMGGGDLSVRRRFRGGPSGNPINQLSFDMDNGTMRTNSFLRMGTESFSVAIGGPNANVYRFLSPAGSITTTLPWTDTGLHVDIKVLNATDVQMTARRLVDNVTYSHTFTVDPFDARLLAFEAFVTQDGFGGDRYEHYFNNLTTYAVPEPGTLAALGLGLAAIIRRRK